MPYDRQVKLLLVKIVSFDQWEGDDHQFLKTPPLLQHCQVKGYSKNSTAFIF